MATNYVLQHSGKEIDTLLEKVQNLPEDISTLKFSIVNELPTEDINLSTIYLVKTANEDYEEYIYINNNWEMLGTTKVDLTDYMLKSDNANNLAQDKGDFWIIRNKYMDVFNNWQINVYDSIENTNQTVSLKKALQTYIFSNIHFLVTGSSSYDDTLAKLRKYKFTSAEPYTAQDGTIFNQLGQIITVFEQGGIGFWHGLNFMIGGNEQSNVIAIVLALGAFRATITINNGSVINFAPNGPIGIVSQSTMETYVAEQIDNIEIPSINGLASETYVNNKVQVKADTTYVNEELAKKADKTSLNGLATENYVNTEIAKKADTTYVNTELNKKANTTDLNGLATESYVNNAVANAGGSDITFGTEHLIPGTSTLPTGSIYFVYE